MLSDLDSVSEGMGESERQMPNKCHPSLRFRLLVAGVTKCHLISKSHLSAAGIDVYNNVHMDLDFSNIKPF